MVQETELLPLSEWIAAALGYWLLVLGVLVGTSVVVSVLTSVLLYGPATGADRVYRMLASSVGDLLRISPRRTWALARLTMQEALRRRVLVGFAVFAVVLGFALWFLSPAGLEPQKLYVSFVLTATTYLVLLVVLLLGAFSLPADISSKTIYTVVTKPVRPSELVLGRILGLVAIGTLMLGAMGAASYVFVVRALAHEHTLGAADVVVSQRDRAGQPAEWRGRTSQARQHRHEVTLGPDGAGATDTVQGHWHLVRPAGQSGGYEVSPAQGQFPARVPHYGHLRFTSDDGTPRQRGISVGSEWAYRSYIRGASLAEAIWTFQGLQRESFPNGLPVEMTIRVFRTTKGDIEQGVLGALTLRNPQNGLASKPINFRATEFHTDHQFIPRKLTATNGRPIDLFNDLVVDGQVELHLQCLEPAQFFGMAQSDVYLLAEQASFAGNFAKGCASIWLQMSLVAALAVMWSTLVNGSVAMLATGATVIGGFFLEFIGRLAAGEQIGGGTLESLVRLVQQKSATSALDESVSTDVITSVDSLINWFLSGLSHLLPDFSQLTAVDYVAEGFDIPLLDLLARHALITAAYVLPVFLLGFVFFKLREVAR